MAANRVTQDITEVFTQNTAANARVTQDITEVFTQNTAAAARVTQDITEVFTQNSATKARVTMDTVCVFYKAHTEPVSAADKKLAEEELSMGLPRNYRFTIKNNTGQTITANNINVYARRHKYVGGVLTYEGSEDTVYTNSGSVTTGSYDSGTGEDNNTDAFVGGAFRFSVTAPVSSSGTVELYLDVSTDGGSTWDDNGLGTFIAALNFTATGTKKLGFRL